jgi:beta-phosphoglucomutase-like phosphatase (HAD superfamily)
MNPAMPSKAYEALIFDCDGTLADSMPVHFLAWQQTEAEHGIAFSEDRFYALAGMDCIDVRSLGRSAKPAA